MRAWPEWRPNQPRILGNWRPNQPRIVWRDAKVGRSSRTETQGGRSSHTSDAVGIADPRSSDGSAGQGTTCQAGSARTQRTSAPQ